jgi:cytochrome c oxidase subunit 1
MTDTTSSESSGPSSPGGRQTVLAYLGISGIVLLLLMLFGFLMRLSQGEVLTLPPDLFYQVMTAHGVGMVGIAGFSGGAVMWWFLSGHVKLSTAVLLANLALFLIGVVMILGAVFLGGFAGAWTFLYPLPALSGGEWGEAAAAVYLLGLLLVGVGFLLLYLDVARALIVRYGGLGRALGWPSLFGRQGAEAPPPAVVVSSVVAIMNIAGIVVGAAIIAMSLVNLFVPAFALDALLAKNLIFFFGHVFINATIYMAVIAVYEILPRYTGRPWPSGRIFLAAWNATLLMVLAVYPHHLLMDFAMPVWMLVMGQIVSYISGLPVLAVTTVATLANLHRSGIKWDLASGLLVLSVFGWAAGIVPAVVDGTIVVNSVMHNTVWVPGHFHFYLLLGMVAMVFGFMCWLGTNAGASEGRADRWAFWCYALGGVGFVVMFLYAGKESVPRRWAVHLPEWIAYDRIASVFVLLVVLAAVVFVLRFLMRVGRIASAR